MDNLTFALLLMGGVYAAFCLLLFIVALYDRKTSKVKVVKPKYDERQLAVQAKAYKYAFITLLGYLLIWALLIILKISWCDTGFGILTGIVLGFTAWSVLCILQDAYAWVRESKAVLILCVNILLFSQSLSAFGRALDEGIIVNGVISGKGGSFLLCFMCIAMDAAFLIRPKLDRKS